MSVIEQAMTMERERQSDECSEDEVGDVWGEVRGASDARNEGCGQFRQTQSSPTPRPVPDRHSRQTLGTRTFLPHPSNEDQRDSSVMWVLLIGGKRLQSTVLHTKGVNEYCKASPFRTRVNPTCLFRIHDKVFLHFCFPSDASHPSPCLAPVISPDCRNLDP